jgi:hypothetical protein
MLTEMINVEEQNTFFVFFIHYFLRQVPLAAGVEQHYNNTNNDFTYNSNKGDITYMFLLAVISKVSCNSYK